MNQRLPARYVAATLALTTLILAACGGPEARKAEALEASQAYLAEGNLDKARIELRNALQIDPNDAEARYLSGVIAEQQDQIRQAAGHYRATLDIDASHTDARAGLAKIHVLAGLPNDAIRIVEEGLADAESKAALLAVRGAARAQLRESDLALADAEAAVADDPNHEEGIALLAGTLTNEQRRDEAIAVLEDGIKRLPDSTDLRLARALMAEEDKAYAVAQRLYQEVIELDANNPDRYLQLAAFYQRRGNIDDAEAALRRGLSVDVGDGADYENAVNRLVAFLERERGRDAAERELIELTEARNPAAKSGVVLGDFYKRVGDVDKAEQYYRDVAKKMPREPDGYDARVRLAALMFDRGERDSGLAMIEEVLEESPRNADALRIRAGLALIENRPDDAIIDFRVLARDDPEAIVNHYGLARAFLQKGDTALAEEAMRDAVRAEPNNLDARIQLAQYLSRAGRPDDAEELIRSVLVRDPENLVAYDTAFRIAFSKREWDQAESRALAMIAINSERPTGHYLLGLAKEAKGEIEAARTAYETALNRDDTAAEPLATWARMLVRNGELDTVLQKLEFLYASEPDDAVVANLYAETLIQAGDRLAARDVLEKAIAMSPEWWLPYRTLAGTYNESDIDTVVALLENGFDATSGASGIGIQLAVFYEDLGRYNDAIAIYEKMHAKDKTSGVIANNLAMLIANYKTDEASIQRAVELTQTFGATDNASFLNTFGWVRLKNGEAIAALPVLRKAADMSPESAIMRYHLGVALHETGQTEEAREALSQALDMQGSFPGADEARALLADINAGNGAG
ncbi:MAG: tetratricopeptide repeat protein [Pseudomonadota bacterium]